MIINKDRFDSERQYKIAKESIDRAYEAKYGKSGIEDMGHEEYENFVDLLLYNSAEDAFHGTNEEIGSGWFNTEMFE